MSHKTTVFGHRGVPAILPENSLAGFDYAVEHHADGIEFDVHLTKDDVPVIMHDEKINRTTNGTGSIHNYRLNELRRFKLANGAPVPTLAEFLQVVANQPVQLNLEFKTNIYHYQGIEQIVLQMVKQTELQKPVIFSSFNLESLRISHELDPNQQYCFLTSHHVANPERFAKREHLAGLHLEHLQDTEQIPQRIWTVDDPKQQQNLFQQQISGIFTNNFAAAMQLRDQVQAVN